MSDSSHQRLDELISRLLNESATADEQSELEELLRTDNDARRRYVHHFDLHAELEDRATSGELICPSRNQISPVRKKPTIAFPIALCIALSIAAVALLAVVFTLSPSASDHVATIVALTGPVQLTGDAGTVLNDLKIGQTINGGTFECSSLESSAMLRFVDGSTIRIAGNTVVTVSDRQQKIMRLRAGNLSANVTPQPVGRPFRILTSTAELEVKGTQFDVLASSSRTKVAVQKGLVRAKRVTDGKSVDIHADHTAVATVEAKEAFAAQQMEQPITTWVGSPTEDVTIGKWVPIEVLERIRIGEDVDAGKVAIEDAKRVYFDRLARVDPDFKGSVFAMPKKAQRRKASPPSANYMIVFDLPTRQPGPIVLVKDSHIRFRGSVSTPTKVSFGFASRDPDGAGKRWSKPEQIQQIDDDFDMIIPLAEFGSRGRDQTTPSPVGWELTHVFCHTQDPKAKLQISHVELIDHK